jgi:hypothetical protein
MSTTKDIAGIVPGVMGIALVGESLKMLPENMTGFKKGKMNGKPFKMKTTNHKNQNKKMIKGFNNLNVGTALLGATAGMVNKL